MMQSPEYFNCVQYKFIEGLEFFMQQFSQKKKTAHWLCTVSSRGLHLVLRHLTHVDLEGTGHGNLLTKILVQSYCGRVVAAMTARS